MLFRSVHLFMLYWGMISFITPPVAIGAFAAASVAGANGIRTGIEAMKLGSVIYFIPFFFVLNPALIGRGSIYDILIVFFSAVIGIILISSSLQGYLIGIGDLKNSKHLEWPIRIMLGLSGILMALPGGKVTGYSNYEINITATLLFVLPILYLLILLVVPIFADVFPIIFFNNDLAIDVFPEEPAPKRVTL